jgi:hypothetical protein
VDSQEELVLRKTAMQGLLFDDTGRIDKRERNLIRKRANKAKRMEDPMYAKALREKAAAWGRARHNRTQQDPVAREARNARQRERWKNDPMFRIKHSERTNRMLREKRRDPSFSEIERATKRENYRSLKADGIAAYGGRCNCPGCNESRSELMSIDHIHGRNTGDPGDKFSAARLWAYLKRLGWPRDCNYQLLCRSCNASKATFGACRLPHTVNERISPSTVNILGLIRWLDAQEKAAA